MSKRFDDARTLTRYLLGSLPSEEAERLDELSVSDDEVAEALRSAENDLVDAYVQDELDEAARAQFKTHYMASAMRRERVAFAQAFQTRAAQGLASQAATTRAETTSEARAEVAEASPRRKARKIFSSWRDFGVARPAWAWGAALAALALVIVCGWLIFENARRRQQPAPAEARRNAPEQQAPEARKESATQQAANARPADERARDERSTQEQTHGDEQRLSEQQRAAEQQHTAEQQRVEQQRAADQKRAAERASTFASFILAPQLRGSSRAQSISIPAGADQVVMRLRLEPNESDAYRVALLDETGARALWQSGAVKARGSADGKILSLNFRARLLKPQTSYLLRVTNDAGEIVDDYSFRVVK